VDPAGRLFCETCGDVLEASSSICLDPTSAETFQSISRKVVSTEHFVDYQSYIQDKRCRDLSKAAFVAAGLNLDELSDIKITQILLELAKHNIRCNRDTLTLAAAFAVARDTGSSVDFNTYCSTLRISPVLLKRALLKISRFTPQTVTPPDIEQIVLTHLESLKPLTPNPLPPETVSETVSLISKMRNADALQACNLGPGALAALVAVLRGRGVAVKFSDAVAACLLGERKSLCYVKFKLAKDYLKR